MNEVALNPEVSALGLITSPAQAEAMWVSSADNLLFRSAMVHYLKGILDNRLNNAQRWGFSAAWVTKFFFTAFTELNQQVKYIEGQIGINTAAMSKLESGVLRTQLVDRHWILDRVKTFAEGIRYQSWIQTMRHWLKVSCLAEGNLDFIKMLEQLFDIVTAREFTYKLNEGEQANLLKQLLEKYPTANFKYNQQRPHCDSWYVLNVLLDQKSSLIYFFESGPFATLWPQAEDALVRVLLKSVIFTSVEGQVQHQEQKTVNLKELSEQLDDKNFPLERGILDALLRSLFQQGRLGDFVITLK